MRAIGCTYSPRLEAILSSPSYLAAFEVFLKKNQAHENLLFLEALSRLNCQQNLSNIEAAVERILKTFIVKNASMEINITCREATEKAYESSRFTVLNAKNALKIFEEAKLEVCQLLEAKTEEFKRIHNMSISNVEQQPRNCQKRVVIIGGGFVGFTVASILDPMSRFHVTLIDAKDSFEYTPGMIKMLVRPEDASSLRVRHESYVKNGRVMIGIADRLENDATMVHVNGESIPFDYLVIATGSSYQSKLKSFDISALYRMTDLGKEYLELKSAKDILIIGGGLVGCELAAEIALHKFPDGCPKKKSVTIVESHSSLVRRSSPSTQKKALEYLQNIGVNVICNEKIVDFDSGEDNIFLGSSGRRFSGFDKIYLATGTSPCSQLLKASDISCNLDFTVDNWDRIRVKPTLQLDHPKYSTIFAGGDVTNVKEEKTGYSATLAGVCIARNICRMEKGKRPLKQGTGGTLSAPMVPLHGKEDQGGIGRQQLSSWKKSFSFLNPTWAALKYFDEQEFIRIVAGETKIRQRPIGRLPTPLNDTTENHTNSFRFYHRHGNHHVDADTHQGSTTNLSGVDVLSSAADGDSAVDLQNGTSSSLNCGIESLDQASISGVSKSLSSESLYARSVNEFQAVKHPRSQPPRNPSTTSRHQASSDHLNEF
ncbi:uncharacterized protein BX664DRAFT_336377 [Halteromyces radiatus]|uniref:uncharacterized protein n=1 Tax=Halteromyces radiatus TaxID=101107 RepID=UPI00221E8944|nr:uncharacterized protein BX664DRAFT_336377 [Halteromyces radiatus]KAI8086634.1 hypothetical protein BX664DRAFT_336377 [Halteromyces radiatus]